VHTHHAGQWWPHRHASCGESEVLTLGANSVRQPMSLLKRVASTLIESLSLARLPRAACDATNLADARRFDHTRVFDTDRCEALWNSTPRELRALPIPHAAWGVNPGDRRALFHLVQGLRPSSVLEVGTHIGASTVHLAAALAQTAQARTSHHGS